MAASPVFVGSVTWLWHSALCVSMFPAMPNITLHMPAALLEAVGKARREHGFTASQVCRDAMQAELKRLRKEYGEHALESPVLAQLGELSDRLSRLELAVQAEEHPRPLVGDGE